MKKYHLFYLLIVLFTISSCSSDTAVLPEASTTPIDNSIVEMTDEQWKSSSIGVGKLELSNVGSMVTLHGKLETGINNRASISLPLGGYIVSSPVLPGQFVNKGSALLIAENDLFIQLQQEYLITKIELEAYTKDFDRQRELNEANAVSTKNAEIAQRNFESSKVQLKALEEKLAYIGISAKDLTENNLSKRVTLRSPISGYVASMNVYPGRLMRPEDIVMEISGRDEIYAVLEFFSNDLQSFENNMDIVIENLNAPNSKATGKIISINTTLSSDGRGQVFCALHHLPTTWVPGSIVKGSLQTTSHSGLVLSEEAIVTWEGKDYIFEEIETSSQSHAFRMLEIEHRSIGEGMEEIFVSPDWLEKKIVTKGAYTLLMLSKNKSDE